MDSPKQIDERMLRFRTRKGNYVLISAADACLTDYLWSEYRQVKRHTLEKKFERTFVQDGKLHRIFLHRQVVERMLGRPLRRAEYVVHVNKDYYDCRRENLAVLTKAQLAGRHPKRLKGTEERISRGKTCYRACIYEAGHRYRIGPFESRLLAALAYDLAVQRLRSSVCSFRNFTRPLSVFSPDEIDMVAERVSQALDKNCPTLWHATEVA